MKHVLCLLLALLMLPALPVLAEETPEEGLVYEVAYEGVETGFWMSDWMLWVPSDWPVKSSEYESAITVGDSFTIHIECMIYLDSLEDIYAFLARGANFKEEFITWETINGFPVMIYRDDRYYFDLGDGNIADFSIVLMQRFLKDYDATRETALQMISSLHLPAEE